MRHRMAGRKLGRTTEHRWAMFRNLVTSLFEHERIKTTDAKAKELQPIAEKLISLAKRGDLHARRQVLRIVRSPEIVGKLFEKISPRFQMQNGGYTRIIKLGNRPGDGAPVALLEIISTSEEQKAIKKRRVERRREKEKRKKAEVISPPEPSGKI